MKKTATAFLIAITIVAAGCSKKDDKAGYPAPLPQPAPAVDASGALPGPPARKTRADMDIVKKAGPAGDLALEFCKASQASDFAALSKLFSPEFIIFAGIGERASSKLTPGELKNMVDSSYRAMSKDMKQSRTTPVRECEILAAENIKCDAAVSGIMTKSPNDGFTISSLNYALKRTETSACGAFEIREISNSGVEYSRFIAGSQPGRWAILISVRAE